MPRTRQWIPRTSWIDIGIKTEKVDPDTWEAERYRSYRLSGIRPFWEKRIKNSVAIKQLSVMGLSDLQYFLLKYLGSKTAKMATDIFIELEILLGLTDQHCNNSLWDKKRFSDRADNIINAVKHLINKSETLAEYQPLFKKDSFKDRLDRICLVLEDLLEIPEPKNPEALQKRLNVIWMTIWGKKQNQPITHFDSIMAWLNIEDTSQVVGYHKSQLMNPPPLCQLRQYLWRYSKEPETTPNDTVHHIQYRTSIFSK